MASVALPTSDRQADAPAAWLFAVAALAVAAGAWFLAGWTPVVFSIVAVFLFAGPHNWMEARFFLARMPGRWGALRGYFSLGLGGVVLLTAAFASLGSIARFAGWSEDGWLTAIAVWNSALVAWIVALALLRSRQNPRRAWEWTVPVGLAVIGLAWLWPLQWDLALVYLHPLIALWFLDRELKRQRPAWRRAYHLCLLAMAALLGLLWWRLAGTPSLPGDDALTDRIARHAGADLLQGVSSRLLVATHTYLEMLHYGVWIVAIPLVSLRTAPWNIASVPLARRSSRWRAAVAGLLCLGLVVVLALWAAFLADYPVTRDVYFTVAMLHVLAEVPFLLRAL